MRSRGSPSFGEYNLLSFGSVREDMLAFLGEGQYLSIFPGRRDIEEILELVGLVRLREPVLEILEYFRLKDSYSYRHFLTVFALSTLLARDLVPGDAEQLRLAATGPTHDVGKVSVSLDVLGKETALTTDERRMLDNHSAAGHVLMAYYSGEPASLASVVALDHHERRDGSGLPRGIRLSDPLVEIIAVADVYDALISPRPYRPVSYDNRSALEEIIGMAERGAVGWNVVKALVAQNRSPKMHYTQISLSAEQRGEPPPGNLHGMVSDPE
jgi:HD-GYP domain-containing protein (c-di-GMP phosphodiesterase class II)